MISLRLKRSRFIKTMSLFLVFAFSLSNVSFAVTDKSVDEQNFADTKSVLSVEDIGISIDSGTIKSTYKGDNGKTIVHIQDAHCNYEAQTNINKILDQLTKECGMNMISVEGAEGIVDTAWFRAFPDAEIRKEVATYFMKKGEITGAEFFSIISDYNGTIFGAETRDYYIKNLKSFTEVYPYKDMIEKYFVNTRTIANRLKSIVYPPKLKELDSKIRAFENKELELSDYAEYLYKNTSALGIDLEDCANFKKLLQTLEYERKIDFDVVDQERSKYIDDLSKKLSKEGMTELVTQSIRFKKGHIKAVDFYSYLRDLAKEHDIPMVREYPNLFYYYIYTKLYEGIDNESLFREIDLVEKRLKKKLFKDETQEKLDKYSAMLDMFINLVNIELTNEDYELFKAYSEEFSIDDVLSFMERLCDKYNLNYDIDGIPVQISEQIPKMIDFYEIAMVRDNALIDNTINRMEKEGTDRCVLIAGGFHTKGIKNILERKGISYAVVTPKITKDVETPYIKVLTNQRTSLEDIITESAAMPGVGKAKLQEDELAPLARAQLVDLYLKHDSSLRELDSEIKWVEGGLSPEEKAKNIYRGMVETVVEGWLKMMETKADPELWKSINKDTLLGAYLMLCKRLEEQEQEKGNKNFRISDETKKIIRDVFAEKFKEKGETPGKQPTGTVLTGDEAERFDRVLADSFTSGNVSFVERDDIAKGLRFVLHNGLTEALVAAGLPANVHPGRGGAALDHKGLQIHIDSYIYEKLDQSERDTIANHELAHLYIFNAEEIAKKMSGKPRSEIEEAIKDQLGTTAHTIWYTWEEGSGRPMGQAQESFVNFLLGYNVTAIAAKIDLLVKEKMEEESVRRVNIDSMRNILTADEYNGYDIIMISSSTPDEAEYQQEVLEKLFADRDTNNKSMKNKVCILSVLDEAEGGQIIGQGNTWRRAVSMFKEWAEQNGVKETDLDNLFKDNKVKIAIYHNGGKGERASPATQALGNSRGAQRLVGRVKNIRGEEIDLELISAVVLGSAPLAATNDGSRIDTYWANQIGFGTIDFSNVERTNYHFDKFVIGVPQNPKKKDLFDYGTAVLSKAGKIIKFLANQSLTRKNKDGLYEDNPDFTKELTELLSAPKGVFDYGSFSMSREMHYALLDYWTNVKKIFEEIDKTGRSPISRDIDSALVQIAVPLVNGLIGKTLPADLPDANTLRTTPQSPAKDKLLDEAYKKLISVMDNQDFIAALGKVYNDAKKKPFVLEAVEFFILYKDVIFSDLDKVVGHVDLGANSHWFAYKRLLDMGNEKFFMLADLIDGNQELVPVGEESGKLEMTSATDEDKVRAEDARRMRGIENNAVSEFIVKGRRIRLTAEDMKKGWEDKELDIVVKGSIIQGHTILLPGSRIINSVINDSQGKIVAENSYIESSTSPAIGAKDSILLKVIDKKAVKADREIIADAFRGEAKNKETGVLEPQIKDSRFSQGQTRMRAPLGYDPKGTQMKDTKLFGDNKYTFQAIRDMECVRPQNDAIEKDIRSQVLFGMVDRQEYLNVFATLGFGTSGLRDLVSNMTDMEAYINTRGYIKFLIDEGSLNKKDLVTIAGDLRPSTARLMVAVAKAVEDEAEAAGYELELDFIGEVPSPTLAFRGITRNSIAIMVTGSHIPFNMNGIKFYKRSGEEVLKGPDEKGILAGVAKARSEEYGKTWDKSHFEEKGMFKSSPANRYALKANQKEAEEQYIERYVTLLPQNALAGQTVVLYEHSAVGNDILKRIYEKLGATVVTVGKSKKFVPIDTEKITPNLEVLLAQLSNPEELSRWVSREQDRPVQLEKPFAVTFTDGDKDRPGLADENGQFLPGDKLGLLVTKLLKPTFVAIPQSTNIEVVKELRNMGIKVVLTSIGSPHVVKAMNDELAVNPSAKTVGWEANGGFLLGSAFKIPGGASEITRLATRDAVLPLIAALYLAKQKNIKTSELIDREIPHFYNHASVYDKFEERFSTDRKIAVATMKGIVAMLKPDLADEKVVSIDFDEMTVERRIVKKIDGVDVLTFEVEKIKIAKSDSDWEKWNRVKEKLEGVFTPKGFSPIRYINVLDGIQIVFENGEVSHLRPSGNAPEFRNYAMASNMERAKAIVEIGVNEIIPSLADEVWALSKGESTPNQQPASPTSGLIPTPEAAKVIEHVKKGGALQVGLQEVDATKEWGRWFSFANFKKKIGEFFWGITSPVKGGGASASLSEVIKFAAESLLGRKVVELFGKSLPLTKILTPDMWLSVQVHDTKNEIWIVTEAEAGAEIILGFNPEAVKKYGDNLKAAFGAAAEKYNSAVKGLIGVIGKKGEDGLKELQATKNALKAAEKFVNEVDVRDARKAVEEAREQFEMFLNKHKVKAGDVIPIPAGTLHALGRGVTVLEPQIPGPTQRVCDLVPWYPSREMHLTEALEAIRYEVPAEEKPTPISEMVERLPGRFEDKGLEVHRITMKKAGDRLPVSGITSYHLLVATKGAAKAVVKIDGKEIPYEIPSVKKNERAANEAELFGGMLLIPAAAEEYTIIAESGETEIIDIFSPVPDIRETALPNGKEEKDIAGTGVYPAHQGVVREDYGTTTKLTEKLTIPGEAKKPDIIENRDHTLIVQEGTVRVEGLKEGPVTLTEGSRYEIKGDQDYVIIKDKDSLDNPVVKIDYVNTENENVVYAVHDAISKHYLAIFDKPVDLVLPKQMFVSSGVGSKEWEEEQLNKYIEYVYQKSGLSDKYRELVKENRGEKLIRIETYDATKGRGLDDIARIKIRPGASAILAATKSSVDEAAASKDAEVMKLLSGEKGKLQVLTIPDLFEIEGKGWFFAREIEYAGVFMTAITPKAIQERQPIALDFQRLMTQLTGRQISWDDLKYFLSWNEVSKEFKNPLEWLAFLVKNLLLKIPIKPYAGEELQMLKERREKLEQSV
ncbi:MAG: hypothetical protein ABID83_05890 [Candidatus Omnitrophota bacterium]